MVQAYGQAWAQIKLNLNALLTQMSAAEAAGTKPDVGWLLEQQRLEMLQRQVEAEINQFAQFAEQSILREQADAIAAAREHAQELMSLAVGGDSMLVSSFAQLPVGAVESMVGFLADGSPLHSLLAELGPQAAAAIKKQLILGVSTGIHPTTTAALIQREFGGNLARALTISRTETLRAYRTASQVTYQANDDILDGYIRLSAGNNRTCGACFALHGQRYKTREQFGDHPNGRCTLAPYSKRHPIAIEPGPERFAKLSDKDQLEILGKKKYGLYKDGTIGLEDLVQHNHSRKWGPSATEASVKDALSNATNRTADTSAAG